MSIRIGIDPGKSGGIVIIDGASHEVRKGLLMPKLPGGKRVDWTTVIDLLRRYADHPDVYVVLEKAQSMPKQGIASAFNYGTHFGILQGILKALLIPYELKTPKQWQKLAGVPSTVKGRAAVKGEVIAIVQRRLPDLDLIPGRCRVVQDGLSDAGGMAIVAAKLRPASQHSRRARRKPPRR